MMKGVNKGEEVPKSSRATKSDIQKLNDRLEEMAAKFTGDLDSFRTVLTSKSIEKEESGDLERLREKFLCFERSTLESLSKFQQEISSLKTVMSSYTMVSNQKALLVHGVSENVSTNVYENMAKLITTNIGVQVQMSDLDYCYRLGRKVDNPKKPRPVVVSFCRRWQRDQVFYLKKKLKGSGILFTELLSNDNLALYKEARSIYKNSCWTFKGRVIVLCRGEKVFVNTSQDLKDLGDLKE